MADTAAPSTEGSENQRVTRILQHWESMRADKVDFDRKCQLVSDYILPRRDFSITQRNNALRPHRVTSSVATNANTRAAAFLLAYYWDPTRPNLLPNVKRGLAIQGRRMEDLDDDSINYLGDLAWNVMDHMSRPKAKMLLRLGSAFEEFFAFGNGVIWTGRRRGFGPYYNGRRFSASWWAENEEGEIDTFYYLMRQPVYRVLERFPKTAPQLWKNPELEKGKSEQNLTDILLTCQPRRGGVNGAVNWNKPFEFCAVSVEKGAILEESGYDSFPYSIYRFSPMPNMAYGEGSGGRVLPDVMVLNHLIEAVENAASQKAQPSIAMPSRMFSRTLDRRPSAVNYYNPVGLGLQKADEAIIKLDMTGDPTDALNIIEKLIQNIELGYYTDWQRLRETGDMTAEEISERRDIRLRGMSFINSNCEQAATQMGERSMEIMLEEGLIPPPPPMLSRMPVDWEYAGPLQIAQLRGNVQSTLQMINARGLVLEQDPDAAKAIDLETSLRTIHQGLGQPSGTLMSRGWVGQQRQARLHAVQQQENAAKLQAVAGAAKDGTAAIGNLAGAAPGGAPPAGAPGPGAPGAPFAPAAPFAQPVAAA